MSNADATHQVGSHPRSPLQALEALQRACQGVAMYGREHPAVRAAMKDASAAIKAFGGLQIQARGVKLYVEEMCISDAAPVDALCARMKGLRIASLVFSPAASDADIAGLVTAWAAIGFDARWGSDNATGLSTATGGRITCAPTSYGGLHVQEGAGDDSDIEIDWSGVGDDLVRVTTGGGGLTATELAGRISSNLDAQLGGIPTSVLESAAEALTQATPEERAAAEARLTVFFSSLSGDIREATSCVDVSQSGRSLRALHELAGPLPVASVVANLDEIEASVLSSTDGVKLLAKLVWLSRDQEKLTSRLDSALAEIRPLVADAWDGGDELESAVDLLQDMVKSKDFNSDSYEALIRRLTHDSCGHSRSRAPIQPWTAESTRLHSTAIAIEIALDQDTPADNLESCVTYIESQFLTLAGAGAFELLMDVARALAAARDRALPGEVVAVIDRCEATMCSSATVAAIIVCAQKAERTQDDVYGLLALCSGRALTSLVGGIMSGSILLNPTVLLNHPAVNMRDLAKGLSRGDPRTLKAVVSLKDLQLERRARLAHAMLGHDNVEYRLIAYQTFHELYERWPTSLLSHALAEDHPAVCQLAIDRLDSDPGNLRTVGVILTGGLGFEPDARLFDSGVAALAGRGAGADLRSLAATLMKKPTPTRMARAARAMLASKRSSGKAA